MATRVWLTEILVSGFNFFVLMRLLYEPLWGELTAHQIGMSMRISFANLIVGATLHPRRRSTARGAISASALTSRR
jgi:hypothetical protein